MMAKVKEGEHAGFLHGRGALDSDDLLYLKEQTQAEQDAENIRDRAEKRAFAAFKISCQTFRLLLFQAPTFLLESSKADAAGPAAMRVDTKPRSGIRQHDLLKNIVEIKPKRQRSDASERSSGTPSPRVQGRTTTPSSADRSGKSWIDDARALPEDRKDSGAAALADATALKQAGLRDGPKSAKSLLGLTYASSEDEDGSDEGKQGDMSHLDDAAQSSKNPNQVLAEPSKATQMGDARDAGGT
eukprot:SM000121S26022  [mRNA]  locus=s121:332821:334069:- [translate_table: standard]